jgi:hypothetical protein
MMAILQASPRFLLASIPLSLEPKQTVVMVLGATLVPKAQLYSQR